MAGVRGECVSLILLTALILASLVSVGGPAAAAEHGPGPAQPWCSVYEGDGASSPSTEGWTVRTFGTTSISGSTSDGATVAIMNDGTTADGGWMQRFLDFEPPFELAVRARYDPATTRTGFLQMAYVFTGTHAFAATYRPSSITISGVPSLTLPATQGAWYNITFDAKAPLDVDVYQNGVLVGTIEMSPTDRIIFDQPANTPVIASLASGPPETAFGMVDYIRTTMCPPTSGGAKTPDRTAPVATNVLLDDGFYRFYSVARDSVGSEGPPATSDAVGAFDGTPPSTGVQTLAPYVRASLPITVEATGIDLLGGLASIELWYSFSRDNVTWTGWQSFGDDVLAPYRWDFLAPYGEGYYEFLSVGRDAVGNAEPAPAVADASARYGIAPAVVSVTPRRDSTHVNVATDITVELDEPMDRASTEAAFSLTGPDGPVNGAFRWMGGDTVLVFIPSDDLEAGATHTARIAATALDRAGNALAQEEVWSFTTEPPPPEPSVNWEPVVAAVLACILMVLAVVASWRERGSRALSMGMLFAVTLLAIGVSSIVIPALAIPPLLGAGIAVDAVLLAVGVAAVVVFRRSPSSTQ